MHDLTGWLRTSSALLAAVTALLVGLTALAQRLMVTWKSAQSGSPAQTVTRWYTIVGLVLVSVGAGTFFARSIVSDLSPINVQGVQMAWSAYNAKDWKASIRFADQCMQQFGPVAEQIQTRLESQHAPIPPTGQVSEMERTRLFQNGVLNDVATCAFIKGYAAERLGRRDVAKQAYQLASRYTYARYWDPNGWFWSPADAAYQRMRVLD